MIYINPIEILDLADKEVSEINSAAIKKAKRKLFADIDLSDEGYYDYHGEQRTKSDCEQAIDELEEMNKLEFYSHLATNVELNNFLATGNTNSLFSLKQESIYKLPEFIEFISPFISRRINTLLLSAFRSNDSKLFSYAVRIKYLISKEDFNTAYKSLANEIAQRIAETDTLTAQIRDEVSEYTEDNLKGIISIIQERFPVELLNQLPSFFQSQINKIAASLNFLQIKMWDKFHSTLVPLRVLEHLLQLKIESVSKPTYEKNYSIVKKKHEQWLEREKNGPTLKKWAKTLISIQEKIVSIESNEYTAEEALSLIHATCNIKELNELPSFADEIRTQIAYSIRSMAIATWNTHNDIKNSLALIKIALRIDVDQKTREDFIKDKQELKALEEKYKGLLVCHFCEIETPDKGCEYETTIYKVTSRNFIFRRVQYTYSNVVIPRCKSCEKAHSGGTSVYIQVVIVTIIASTITGGLIIDTYIGGGVIGVILGMIFGTIIDLIITKNKGIRGLGDSTLKKHPLIADRIKNGWSLSQPSA